MFRHPLPRIVPSPGVPVPAAADGEHRRRSGFRGTEQSSAGITPKPPLPGTPLPALSHPSARTGEPRLPQPRRRLASAREARSTRKGCRMSPKSSKAPEPSLLGSNKRRNRLQSGKARAEIPAALNWGVWHQVALLRPPAALILPAPGSLPRTAQHLLNAAML